MSLKAILESHPIKNLNAVIRSVKSDVAPKLALSKDKKRHSKEKLIEHILALDKMGLLKERPTMYEKPVRAKKVKAVPKSAGAIEAKRIKKKIKAQESKPKVEDKPKQAKPIIVVDVEKAKKAGIKIDESKATKAGVKLIKKKEKKAEPDYTEITIKGDIFF